MERITRRTKKPKQGNVSKVNQEESGVGEDVKVIGSRQHPLLISVILKRLFQLTQPSFQDLKSFRSVCKTWYDETLDLWRKSTVLKVIPVGFTDKNGKGITADNLVNEFSQSDSSLHRNPYKRCRILTLAIDKENGSSISKHFWDAIGVHIEDMSIHEVVLSSDYVPEQLVAFLKDHLPNVKRLLLRTVTITDQVKPEVKNAAVVNRQVIRNVSGKGDRPESLIHPNLKTLLLGNKFKIDLDIYLSFPNLQSLTLTGSAFTKFFTATAFQAGNFFNSSLQRIYIDGARTPARYNRFCQDLGKTKMPSLEHLRVKINPILGPGQSVIYDSLSTSGNTNQENAFYFDRYLDTLLEANALQLKTLSVFTLPFPNGFSLTQRNLFKSRMDSLTEFHLWGNLIKCFDFLQFMPNLKHLYISLACVDKKDEIKREIEVRKSAPPSILPTHVILLTDWDMVTNAYSQLTKNVRLEALQFLHIDFQFPDKSLEILSRWMPNLKTLKTIVGRKTLPVVCNNWPGLKEFVCLYGSKIEDNDVKILLDLQELEIFQLQADCNEGLLSDMAVKEGGLIKMTCLKKLEICVSEKMSSEAAALLRKHVPFVRLIRNYTGNREHNNWDCCQRKEYLKMVEETLQTPKRYYSGTGG